MKLKEMIISVQNKWHLCQTNMDLYDENEQSSNTQEINELPTEDGLYFVYMWDYFQNPQFFYITVQFTEAIQLFNYINANSGMRNRGIIQPSQVIKWMKYNGFLKVIEG